MVTCSTGTSLWFLLLILFTFCFVFLLDAFWHIVLKIYKAITILFNSSPKRECLFEYIVRSRCNGAEKRKVLVGMCKTRWSERDISYEHFYIAIPFMVETFEIMNGTYPKNNDFDSFYKDGWDSETKEDATSYLNAITKFEFLIGLVSLYRLLHPLVGITQNLQGRSIDIIKAYNEVVSMSCNIWDKPLMRNFIKFTSRQKDWQKSFM